MIDKEECKRKYLELKQKMGKKPDSVSFLKYIKITSQVLGSLFGSNAFSKLQIECGDTPNTFFHEKTPTDNIFIKWGELCRKLNKFPTQADWSYENIRPRASSITHAPHNLIWSEIPKIFLEKYKNQTEWFDVINIIQNYSDLNIPNYEPIKKNEYDKIVDIIISWIPARKRNQEEGYKVELRSHFENLKYKVSEEKGDSKADLIINDKYPIELKKSPNFQEYDRLFGQTVRHVKYFDSLIIVIFDVEKNDQYNEFTSNIDYVFENLDKDVTVISK